MNHSIKHLLAVALMVTAVGRAGEFQYAAPEPGTYQLPVVKAAADGEVLDSKGESHRLHDLTRGRITVMSFIYTRCGDAKACPYATGVLRELHELSVNDPVLTNGLRLISMSFDPENDTPARLSGYAEIARTEKPAAEWRFVTTESQDKLKPILDGYGQVVDRKRNANDPTGPLNHILRVFLIDRNGRIRNIYSSSTLDVRLVLADVRTLMMEPPDNAG
jgi:protein SCO1/2